MSDRVTYEYAVIRLVPRVEREEFINVGVLLFSKRRRYLDMRHHLDIAKAQALDASLDPAIVQRYLQAWELICQGDRRGGAIALLDTPERFRWLAASKSTILQCSPVHPGLCDAPESVLERLMEQYVR